MGLFLWRSTSVEEVCSELKQLLLKQTETLRAQTVGGLTEVGLLEYQQRYDVERLTRRKPITFDQFARDYAFAFHDEAKVAS